MLSTKQSGPDGREQDESSSEEEDDVDIAPTPLVLMEQCVVLTSLCDFSRQLDHSPGRGNTAARISFL